VASSRQSTVHKGATGDYTGASKRLRTEESTYVPVMSRLADECKAVYLLCLGARAAETALVVYQ
jgi:hypothetical protein